MTRKRRGLSMTSILVLALVGTITAIVLGAMAVFLQTYQRSLIRSVQTSARQTMEMLAKSFGATAVRVEFSDVEPRKTNVIHEALAAAT